MKRPTVGITAWRRVLDTVMGPETLQALSAYYSEAAIEAGMIPMIFPNGQDPAAAGKLVSTVDGVILSGGDDIAASIYGAEESDSVWGADPAVDRFEIAVVEAARDQNKPLLAICRGIQLLNVALGGTLRQEVTTKGAVHELVNSDSDPDELETRRHTVHLEDGSLLAGLYASDEIKVNSLHHQGVDRLAAGLIVEGKAPDGLVEAARWTGSWWALAVQWHPERMGYEDHSPLFAALRKAIVATQPSSASAD